MTLPSERYFSLGRDDGYTPPARDSLIEEDLDGESVSIIKEGNFRDEIDRRFIYQAIFDILQTLYDREKNVINLLYFKEYTKYQVGKMMGITRERVRQIEAKALKKLRHPFRSDRLKSIFHHEKPIESPLLNKFKTKYKDLAG